MIINYYRKLDRSSITFKIVSKLAHKITNILLKLPPPLTEGPSPPEEPVILT